VVSIAAPEVAPFWLGNLFLPFVAFWVMTRFLLAELLDAESADWSRPVLAYGLLVLEFAPLWCLCTDEAPLFEDLPSAPSPRLLLVATEAEETGMVFFSVHCW